MKSISKRLRKFLKDVWFVGLWKYWRGFRPAYRVIRSREKLYPETGGITPRAREMALAAGIVNILAEKYHKEHSDRSRGPRVQSIIIAQEFTKKRCHRKMVSNVA